MAAESFSQALALVLRHEGGYADHPADPGGATMMGITQATLASWRGRPVSKAEVRAVPRDEVAAIYRARYWNAINGDALPAGIDLAVFDYAVNSGPGRAARTLQGIAGTEADGLIGPRTVAAIASLEPQSVIVAYCKARRAFLSHLPTAPVFGRGWMRRVVDVEKNSLNLLKSAAVSNAPSRSEAPLKGANAAPVSPPPHAQKETLMEITKTFFLSRTVWANLIGFGSLALSILGFRTGEIDANLLADRILEIIAAGSFIASTVFRVVATKRLT